MRLMSIAICMGCGRQKLKKRLKLKNEQGVSPLFCGTKTERNRPYRSVLKGVSRLFKTLYDNGFMVIVKTKVEQKELSLTFWGHVLIEMRLKEKGKETG